MLCKLTWVSSWGAEQCYVSRVDARNSPGTHPYCNRQPLQKISQIERNRENLTTRKFFPQIIFNVTISRSMVEP